MSLLNQLVCIEERLRALQLSCTRQAVLLGELLQDVRRTEAALESIMAAEAAADDDGIPGVLSDDDLRALDALDAARDGLMFRRPKQ